MITDTHKVLQYRIYPTPETRYITYHWLWR